MVIMEITINGNTVSGTAGELAAILAVMDTATETAIEAPKQKREPKPKPVMSKPEQAMANRAIASLAKLGFDCKARKQGTWLWVYPTDGKGRTEEFRAAKLAKGWTHSPKRGAFYRKMD